MVAGDTETAKWSREIDQFSRFSVWNAERLGTNLGTKLDLVPLFCFQINANFRTVCVAAKEYF